MFAHERHQFIQRTSGHGRSGGVPYVHAKPRGRRPDRSASRKYGAAVGRVNVRRRMPNEELEGSTEAAAANAAARQDVGGQDVSPLDFLLGLMRDPQTPPHLRIRLAHIVAPYVSFEDRLQATRRCARR
jgi:hypothetical protein